VRVSVLDIAQQSKPYRNIGKIHVLYSFNFVEMARRDLQIGFSKLCMAARVMALRRLTSQVLPIDMGQFISLNMCFNVSAFND